MRINGLELELSISLRGKYLPLSRRFAEAGFSAAELNVPIDKTGSRNMEIYQPHFARWIPEIRDSGLRLHSLHLPFGNAWDIAFLDKAQRSNVIDDLSRVMAMISGKGFRYCVLHGSPEPVDAALRRAKLDICHQSVQTLAHRARDLGFEIVLEVLPRTCLGNCSREIEELTDGGFSAKVCMDTTHIFQETVPQFMDRCERYIVHTHLSDSNGQEEWHTPPGTGSVPFGEIVRRLTALKYCGVFNFELRSDENGQPYEPVAILEAFSHQIG